MNKDIDQTLGVWKDIAEQITGQKLGANLNYEKLTFDKQLTNDELRTKLNKLRIDPELKTLSRFLNFKIKKERKAEIIDNLIALWKYNEPRSVLYSDVPSQPSIIKIPSVIRDVEHQPESIPLEKMTVVQLKNYLSAFKVDRIPRLKADLYNLAVKFSKTKKVEKPKDKSFKSKEFIEDEDEERIEKYLNYPLVTSETFRSSPSLISKITGEKKDLDDLKNAVEILPESKKFIETKTFEYLTPEKMLNQPAKTQFPEPTRSVILSEEPQIASVSQWKYAAPKPERLNINKLSSATAKPERININRLPSLIQEWVPSTISQENLVDIDETIWKELTGPVF